MNNLKVNFYTKPLVWKILGSRRFSKDVEMPKISLLFNHAMQNRDLAEYSRPNIIYENFYHFAAKLLQTEYYLLNCFSYYSVLMGMTEGEAAKVSLE